MARRMDSDHSEGSAIPGARTPCRRVSHTTCVAALEKTGGLAAPCDFGLAAIIDVLLSAPIVHDSEELPRGTLACNRCNAGHLPRRASHASRIVGTAVLPVEREC